MAVIGPVDCEPLTPLVPDQAPEAEHEVALLLVQVRVEEPPELTVLGLAWSVTAAGGSVTVTVVDWVADEPPGPVHASS